MPDDTTVTETSTKLSPMKIRPTPLERLHGRLMRAPDHGEADPAAPPADPVAPPAADPPAAPAADEGSLMGKAGTDPAAPPADPADPPADPAAPADPKPPEAVIPETYELAMPEGFAVDAALLEEATPVFKDIGLTNEQANKLVPMAAKLSENLAKQQQDNFQAMASDWAREAQKDPEIGGAKWTETENYVAKALDTFGAPKDSPFRKLLDDSKLGNHPEMIRMFRKIGERVSEDSDFVRSDAGAHIKPSREDILYGASETK